MKTNIKISILVVVIIVLVGAIAVYMVSPGGELKKVRYGYGWIYDASFAAHLLALEKGWFEEAGLDIEFSTGKGATLAIQTLGLGKVDMTFVAVSACVIGRSQGIPVKCVAAYEKPPFAIVTADPEITTPYDLVGKRIGLQVASVATIFYHVLMEKLGIDMTKIEEVPIGYDIVSPIASDEVDAVAAWGDGFITLQRSGYPDARSIFTSEYGVGGYGMGTLTTDSFAKNNPDVIRKVLDVLIRAYKYTYDTPGHMDEAADIVVKYNPDMNRDIERARMDVIKNSLLDPIGPTDLETWTQVYDALLEGKGISVPVPDLNDIFTNEFLP